MFQVAGNVNVIAFAVVFFFVVVVVGGGGGGMEARRWSRYSWVFTCFGELKFFKDRISPL